MRTAAGAVAAGALDGLDAEGVDELIALLDASQRAQAASFLGGRPAWRAPDEADPGLAGQRLGAYVLEAPLGHGGGGRGANKAPAPGGRAS